MGVAGDSTLTVGQVRRCPGARVDPHLLPLEVVVLGLVVLTGHCGVTCLLEGAAGCEGGAWLARPGQGCRPGGLLGFLQVPHTALSHPGPPTPAPSPHCALPRNPPSSTVPLYQDPLFIASPQRQASAQCPRPPNFPGPPTAPPPIKDSLTRTSDHHCSITGISRQLLTAGQELPPFHR